MTRVIVRRALLTLPTLIGVSLFIAVLVRLTPGDPAVAIAGPYAPPSAVNAIRVQYHLNESLPLQYVHWLWNALHGNLGFSAYLDEGVGGVVLSSVWHTLILVGCALLLAVLVGVALGVLAGTHPDSRSGKALMAANVATANVPPYVLGLVLVLVFSTKLGVLPSGSMYNLREPGGFPDLLQHLVLPTIAVAAHPMMIIARMTRASIVDTSRQEYVLVARAVGMRPRRILRRYLLWNSLPPIISVSGLQVGALLGGALFAEVIFSWPGAGSLLYQAILAHDVLVIQAVTLFIALTFIIVNLLADVLSAAINPQSRAAS